MNKAIWFLTQTLERVTVTKFGSTVSQIEITKPITGERIVFIERKDFDKIVEAVTNLEND